MSNNMQAEWRVGWWCDLNTCIGCDVPRERLPYYNHIEVILPKNIRDQPHGHEWAFILCDDCSNLWVNPASDLQARISNRLAMARAHCQCGAFFVPDMHLPPELQLIYGMS